MLRRGKVTGQLGAAVGAVDEYPAPARLLDDLVIDVRAVGCREDELSALKVMCAEVGFDAVNLRWHVGVKFRGDAMDMGCAGGKESLRLPNSDRAAADNDHRSVGNVEHQGVEVGHRLKDSIDAGHGNRDPEI